MVISGKDAARQASAAEVAELAGAIVTFPERLPALTVPLLVMVGTGDRLVPPEESAAGLRPPARPAEARRA